jgi:hypothetical protein
MRSLTSMLFIVFKPGLIITSNVKDFPSYFDYASDDDRH